MHRWGDAPIQSVALKLFADPTLVRHVRATYVHLSGSNAIVAGAEVPFDDAVAALPITKAYRRVLQAALISNGTLVVDADASFDDAVGGNGWVPIVIVIASLTAIFATALTVGFMRFKSSSRAMNVAPGPKKAIQRTMLLWGSFLVDVRVPVTTATSFLLLVLSALLPQYGTTSAGTQQDWAPSGGKFEEQLKQVDTWLNGQSNNNLAAFVFVRMADGRNLLDDPKTYLRILERVARRVKENTVTEFQPASGGDTVTLDWFTVCLSLEHPLVDVFVPGGRTRPCVNPSALDAFNEGIWAMEEQAHRARQHMPPAHTLLHTRCLFI